MIDKTDEQAANADDVYLKSMFYEQLVERQKHVPGLQAERGQAPIARAGGL